MGRVVYPARCPALLTKMPSPVVPNFVQIAFLRAGQGGFSLGTGRQIGELDIMNTPTYKAHKYSNKIQK